VCVSGGFNGMSVVAPVLAVGLFLLGNYTLCFSVLFYVARYYNHNQTIFLNKLFDILLKAHS